MIGTKDCPKHAAWGVALILALVSTTGQVSAQSSAAPVAETARADVLATRDAVWRAWFANDRVTLDRLLPADMIALNAGDSTWYDRAGVLRMAAQFAAAGGRLVELYFPRTRVQRFGDVAIVYSTYRIEFQQAGQRYVVRGRATDTFVKTEDSWINTGWHRDSFW